VLYRPTTPPPPVPVIEPRRRCRNSRCGGVFVPRKPWQEFCSQRCRQAALRGRQARVTHGMAHPTGAAEIIAVRPSPIAEVPVNTHASRPENQGGSAPSHVIEAEVFGGRTWRQVASSDGVVCEVGRLRPRALREGSAPWRSNAPRASKERTASSYCSEPDPLQRRGRHRAW